MKDLKRRRKIFLEKNEKMYFWQKPEGVILHEGNFDSTKSSLHTGKKNEKNGKNSENFFHYFIC